MGLHGLQAKESFLSKCFLKCEKPNYMAHYFGVEFMCFWAKSPILCIFGKITLAINEYTYIHTYIHTYIYNYHFLGGFSDHKIFRSIT